MNFGEILLNRVVFKTTLIYLTLVASVIVNSELTLTKRLLELIHLQLKS